VSEFRFDGRVAIVTGAGRGIGRAHARLLAARGARVVVNDLGGSMEGEGSDAGPAADAVDELVAAGGTAIADTSDISTPEGGEAVVNAALERFGRIDVIVNSTSRCTSAARSTPHARHGPPWSSNATAASS
jgi:NAD(P)-dependent dehydrogenase (short-subunit alcohol dehydrogenase family)